MLFYTQVAFPRARPGRAIRLDPKGRRFRALMGASRTDGIFTAVAWVDAARGFTVIPRRASVLAISEDTGEAVSIRF